MADRIVDARGRSCPEPVVMTKKALETIQGEFQVLVDSEVARENVQRFAQNKGCQVRMEEGGNEWKITISP
ncbi:MAG: preprotein translocase subunit TatB [Clostridia bacterium]|nr:preprotein translocase subunit TatB [Clostridia bacterium]